MATIITDKELAVLRAILRSDYQNGTAREDVVGKPVWSFSVTDQCDLPPASMGGAVASLHAKGLVGTQNCRGEDATLWLTSRGWATLTHLKG